jgi:hypothetical protein
MLKLEWVILGTAAAAVVVFVLWMRKRERFTVHELDTPTCISTTDDLLPNSDKMNVPLQPNTVRLAIQGYNYQETPIFYRDDKKILPMEFAWDYTSMMYFYTLAAPNGVCNHDWILETYDFVKPLVVNQDTGEPMEVLSVRRRYGYNKWRLRCK